MLQVPYPSALEAAPLRSDMGSRLKSLTPTNRRKLPVLKMLRAPSHFSHAATQTPSGVPRRALRSLSAAAQFASLRNTH